MKQDTITTINHKDNLIAENIYAIFQSSYIKEAELIGVEDFPPLRRTASDLQKSNTNFVGYWKDDSLVAVIELDENEIQLEICISS